MFAQALDARVTSFSLGDYALNYDLDWIERLRSLRAVEPVILFGARILEALCRDAVGRFERPQEELVANLKHLKNSHHLSPEQHRWMNRLRDLGNDARHANRPLHDADADIAFLVTLRWLEWFFCEFRLGLRLARLTVPNQPLDALLPRRWADFLDRLDRADVSDKEFLSSLRLDKSDSEILLSPVVPAVLVERLLDRKLFDTAQAILHPVRRRFPNDLRVRQLQGLLWSSTEELEKARVLLERIPPTGTDDDEETLGILAGVYKRLAHKEPAQTSWLQKCHEQYRKGWERSGQTNLYLGINAAFTSLELGQGESACGLAAEVARHLETRCQHQIAGATLPYWDQVTLAEALLYERPKEADVLYQNAFRAFPTQLRNIEVAREQARRTLQLLGHAVTDFGFLTA